MPLIITAELPTPDIAIVWPVGGEGRVMMFIDPRVPFALAADTVAHVREILHGGDGQGIARLAEYAQGLVYALG